MKKDESNKLQGSVGYFDIINITILLLVNKIKLDCMKVLVAILCYILESLESLGPFTRIDGSLFLSDNENFFLHNKFSTEVFKF